MARAWEAEQTIEAELALRLIREQFPEIGAEKITPFGSGWDNTAYLVGDRYVFRFPRRKEALPLINAEWCVLPKIAARLPISTPFPKWKGEGKYGYPWPFLGYEKLLGHTACQTGLSEEERIRLAAPLGHFLQVLHALPIEEFQQCHLEAKLEWISREWLIEKITTNLQECKELSIWEETDFSCLHQKTRLPEATALIHGDFYFRHLLLNDKRELTGVIDWGDTQIGDPAKDLAIAHNFLPPSAHSLFRKAYGPITEETWNLACLRALHSSLSMVLFGYHTSDPTILQEALYGLKLFSFR